MQGSELIVFRNAILYSLPSDFHVNQAKYSQEGLG